MEPLSIHLGNDKEYDRLVHGPESLRDKQPITIVTKDKGTEKGNPIVVISFEVEMPDGTFRRAQACTTVRLFQMAAAAMRGRYGDV